MVLRTTEEIFLGGMRGWPFAGKATPRRNRDTEKAQPWKLFPKALPSQEKDMIEGRCPCARKAGGTGWVPRTLQGRLCKPRLGYSRFPTPYTP